MSINGYIRKFIQKEKLNSQKVKLLLAVSGGLDSMVLLHLMHHSGVELGVATVNYKLRSHADVECECVVTYCEKHTIPHFLYSCIVTEQEDLKKSNLQEKARDIRYSFFQEVMSKNYFTHLMTAHHADDVIEGFLLALNRGSGLDGLSPMAESESGILRPLLKFTKKELHEYALSHDLRYEEDESNLTNDYDRNYLRNEIIPAIEDRFSSFKKSALHSTENIADSKRLLDYLVHEQKNHFIKRSEEGIEITNIHKIREIPGRTTLLLMFIKEFGYNGTQCAEMLESNITGAIWQSNDYMATLHENSIIIRPLKGDELLPLVINGLGEYNIDNSSKLIIKKVDEVLFEKSKNIEYVDGTNLKFPLTMRRWEPGDKMKPIGMNGQSKKIQDLLTDAKINRLDKKKSMLLCSNDKVVWLVNIRLDDRFKVDRDTSNYIKLQYIS